MGCAGPRFDSVPDLDPATLRRLAERHEERLQELADCKSAVTLPLGQPSGAHRSSFPQYVRLMEHWRKVLPVMFHDVDYEETVTDLETVARRLVSACGLEWDPACFDFHQTQRPIRTASVTQVRQPVYQRSVTRWRHYEGELAELPSYGNVHACKAMQANPSVASQRGHKGLFAIAPPIAFFCKLEVTFLGRQSRARTYVAARVCKTPPFFCTYKK